MPFDVARLDSKLPLPFHFHSVRSTSAQLHSFPLISALFNSIATVPRLRTDPFLRFCPSDLQLFDSIRCLCTSNHLGLTQLTSIPIASPRLNSAQLNRLLIPRLRISSPYYILLSFRSTKH